MGERSYYSEKSYTTVTYSRILITSELLKNSLAKHGVGENKTFQLTFPDILKSLQFHYIRGYFDGEGSLSYYAKANTYQVKICGTKEMLEEIKRRVGFVGHKLYKRHDGQTNNYYISIGGNMQVISIMDLLYKYSTISLDRNIKNVYN